MEDLRLTEVPVATIQRTGWRGQERTRGSNLNHPVRRGGRCTGAVAVVNAGSWRQWGGTAPKTNITDWTGGDEGEAVFLTQKLGRQWSPSETALERA